MADVLETLNRWASHPDFWKYVSIPFVAGVVGWATNWLAVRLTFWPLEFIGRRPIGWQGIIPSKAAKMAAIFVDETMSQLGTLPEFFADMEPRRIGDHITHVMAPRMREYTDDVMMERHPRLWETLPKLMREPIYQRVDDSLPVLIDGMMEEIADRVDELVDLKEMITARLVEDKALLNRLFTESGAKEFRFIVRSGFMFGFPFGLVQLAVWVFLPAWWVLPLFGVLVGWATNWIALNIIFRPLNPVRIGPFTLQGIFLKRQYEVSDVWSGVVTSEIMTISNIVDNMLHGSRSETTHKLVRRHLQVIADEAAGNAKGLAQATVGVDGFLAIKQTVGSKALSVSTAPFEDPGFIADRAKVVQKVLSERMRLLPPEGFQNLLRPCFQEDEWKLVLLGAILGGLAGVAQLLLVFGGS